MPIGAIWPLDVIRLVFGSDASAVRPIADRLGWGMRSSSLLFCWPRVHSALGSAQVVLVCAVVLAGVSLSGCKGDSTATLFADVKTDFVPGVEFTRVVVEMDGTTEAASADLGADFLGGQRLARFERSAGESVDGVVRLFNGAALLVERRFVVELRAGVQTTTLVLTRDCRDVECPSSLSSATACLGGVCVDPQCSVETPEFCSVDACASASECEVMDTCSEARCELGVCLYGDGNRCGGGLYCSPEVGCLVVPSGMDAGAADAGAADAGAADGGTDALFDAGMSEGCGSAIEIEAFVLTNGARAAEGRPALICDADLAALARAHSADMCARDYFGHINPDGQGPSDRVSGAGLSHRGISENIGSGGRTALETHTQWMSSSAHSETILSANYTRIGVGYASCPTGYRHYWTQIFAQSN